jgi:hypothetical protein
VWTVDHHPSLCGTAKFSHQLAERLGVPCVPVGTPCNYPLISVRASEVDWETFARVEPYDLFLHDWEPKAKTVAEYWTCEAERVFVADTCIGRQIGLRRTVELFAPATIQGNASRPGFRVLTFGMAHKLKARQYRELKAWLEVVHPDYTVSVSTAVHEGSPWDATAQVADELRAIFGSHLRVLGYLADDALARELQECDLVALFYEPALRANNTTYWAAKAAGKPIVTNRDNLSPSDDDPHTWGELLSIMEATCVASR